MLVRTIMAKGSLSIDEVEHCDGVLMALTVCLFSCKQAYLVEERAVSVCVNVAKNGVVNIETTHLGFDDELDETCAMSLED